MFVFCIQDHDHEETIAQRILSARSVRSAHGTPTRKHKKPSHPHHYHGNSLRPDASQSLESLTNEETEQSKIVVPKFTRVFSVGGELETINKRSKSEDNGQRVKKS